MTKGWGSLFIIISLFSLLISPTVVSAKIDGLLKAPYLPANGYDIGAGASEDTKDINISWNRLFLDGKVAWQAYQVQYLYAKANRIGDGELSREQCLEHSGWVTARHQDGSLVRAGEYPIANESRIHWKINGGNDIGNGHRIAQPALFRIQALMLDGDIKKKYQFAGDLPVTLACTTSYFFPATSNTETIQVRLEAYKLDPKDGAGEKVSATIKIDGQDPVVTYNAPKNNTDLTLKVPYDDTKVYNSRNPHKIRFTATGYHAREIDVLFLFPNTYRVGMQPLDSTEKPKDERETDPGGIGGGGGEPPSPASAQNDCSEYLGFAGFNFRPGGYLVCQMANLLNFIVDKVKEYSANVPV